MRFSPQIPLPLEPRRACRFDNYVAGPNDAVVAAIRDAAKADESCLLLRGPASSGKTHLLTALCHATREGGREAFYAGLGRMPGNAHSTLEGLEDYDVVCVDDLQSLAGHDAWEKALFRLFNDIRDAGGTLVVATDTPLSKLGLQLPDLRSRLASGLRLKLQPLDEASKLEVMHRYASSLGIELPADVATYLLRRGRRGIDSLLATIDSLREVAFKDKRRITVPLAREVMRGSLRL